MIEIKNYLVYITDPDFAVRFWGWVFPLKLPISGALYESPS